MRFIEQITSYLRSSADEVKKVSWPSREATIRYSALIVGVSILAAVFFAGLDLGFTKLVELASVARQSAIAPAEQPAAPVTPDTTSTQTTPTLELNPADVQTTKVTTSTQ